MANRNTKAIRWRKETRAKFKTGSKKVISYNKERGTEMVIVNGRTVHRAIDPNGGARFKPVVALRKERKPKAAPMGALSLID